eukprot:164008-Lingulodinium_polyedra.AAC.1
MQGPCRGARQQDAGMRQPRQIGRARCRRVTNGTPCRPKHAATACWETTPQTHWTTSRKEGM